MDVFLLNLAPFAIFNGSVQLPTWLFIVILLFAFVMVLDRILMPSVRWYLRRKVNRIIGEVSDKLSIKIRAFQLTKKQTLVDRLVFDEQVIVAIKEYAKANEMPIGLAQKKALDYANEITPKFNAYLYFKLGRWLAKTFSRLVYRVKVGLYDQGKLAKIGEDSSVVFVMNHRSNMDYVVVSFLVAGRTALSYAVGEWARVWPLQTLILAMGAFFVRRGSNNPLYRKVLERYVHFATRAGVSQAVFLEGGLSKDGLLKEPKLGFLDYMVRDFNAETDRDLIFIPVGLNYDRVIEDRSLELSLQLDKPKRSKWFVVKTTTKFLLKTLFMSRKERWRRFGYAGVNFSKPISAKNYFASLDKPIHLMSKEERFDQVSQLASDLMKDIAKVVPILPVALISKVLTKYQQPIDKQTILQHSLMVIESLKSQGAPVNIADNAYEGVLNKTLELFVGRGLLELESGEYRITENSHGLFNYYANSISQWSFKVLN